MAITKETLDDLLKDYQKPEELLGENVLLCDWARPKLTVWISLETARG